MPLVKLFSAEDHIEAHLLRHMLEQQRIPVFITGEYLEGAVGELPAGGGLVDVWVLDDFLADAQDVLDDFLDSLDGPGPDDEDELLDADGYYLDDAPDEADEPPAPKPRHDSADNPWNRVYRRGRHDDDRD